MALNLEDKKALVAEVARVAAKAQSVVAAEYRGLTVGQMTELRSKARGARRVHACGQEHAGTQGARRHVVRIVGPKLKGPLVLAFSKDDPGAAARVVKDFAKANEKLVATLVSLGGQVLPAAELERVASLPTREQALSMLLGVLKAPIAEARAHAGRAAGEARTHRRRGTRQQTGRGRLSVLITFWRLTWLSTKTKSSMQFPR